MKKIIIINHYGITPEFPGATKHFDIAEQFAKEGEYQIEFWICGVNHQNDELSQELKGFKFQYIEKRDNFDIVKIKSIRYKNSKLRRQINILLFDLITGLKLLFSKDVEYVFLSVPPVTFFNVLFTKLRKIKLITDLEDLWPLFLEEMGLSNRMVIKYYETLANMTYNLSNGISAVSEGMKSFVKGKISDSLKPVWFSPLGVNFEEYENLKPNSKLIIDKPWKDDFIIMYLGAHGKANDLYSVLNTIEVMSRKNYVNIQDKHISFVFIGGGSEKRKIIEYAKLKQIENVYFEDSVPGEMVPEFLSFADICLTNLQKIESFKLVRPNKLFQYMAIGKPIITGIWGEFQNIVEKYNSGIYVDFTDPDDASEKIYKLANNSEKMNEMGNNGIKYIKKYGDRYKIYRDLYEKITSIK